MTPASLVMNAPGQLSVTGPMVFATAGDLLAASRSLLVSSAPVTINLATVTDADSAGLALLLEWLRWGRAEGRSTAFAALPEKLLAIARLSDVDGLLQAGYCSSSSG